MRSPCWAWAGTAKGANEENGRIRRRCPRLSRGAEGREEEEDGAGEGGGLSRGACGLRVWPGGAAAPPPLAAPRQRGAQQIRAGARRAAHHGTVGWGDTRGRGDEGARVQRRPSTP